MSWGSALSSADSSLERTDPSQSLVLGLRERKNEREVIGDGAIDLERNVRINEAEAVDAAALHRREEQEGTGENTPTLAGGGGSPSEVAT